ncbi:glycosyltransferase family 9 protein [Dictyobacter arantiisoli]|uniref:LPS biosynthesis-related glycosyltransferase n=1 Tax=Dictyobacter arantiisoli TaxID=2014874 RepID=A0A5A5T947_9CHLR|nr:glycosyltransferase family 9 protein [Dictyobacter arantiisoli]GCF07519.1 LPS biosynthesis-related glycosyltransferase [Dictyobacter arantiisoli]
MDSTLCSIAIFRALQLGDLLVAVPALRALRAQFPAAEITLIGLPWAAAFVERYRCYLDHFVEFAGYPGLNEVVVDEERTQRFIEEQRARNYDLVLQMHGSGQSSNPLALALHGKRTAGYYKGRPPSGLTLAAEYPETLPEVQRNLGLAALVGCSELDPRLEFPLQAQDQWEAAALLAPLVAIDRPVIGLHPGARPAARRWPAEYFARVADTLAQRYAAQIILTGVEADETTVLDVLSYMHVPALNLVGKTSLGGLAALLSRLDLFVSNDTGPAHIAEAVCCPGITLFGPADYRRWAPLDQTIRHALRRPVPCSPCDYWECPIDHRCLRWLAPSEVIASAEKLLATCSRDNRDNRGMQRSHA